jgi:hypothetical protein
MKLKFMLISNMLIQIACAQSVECVEIKDSTAQITTRVFLASFHNSRFAYSPENESTIKNSNFISTQDCPPQFSLNQPVLYSVSILKDYYIGHLLRTNLYCLYDLKSNSAFLIKDIKKFNEFISQKRELTPFSKSLLYLLISGINIEYPVIKNWPDSIDWKNCNHMLRQKTIEIVGYEDRIGELRVRSIRPVFYLKENDNYVLAIKFKYVKGRLKNIKTKRIYSAQSISILPH